MTKFQVFFSGFRLVFDSFFEFFQPRVSRGPVNPFFGLFFFWGFLEKALLTLVEGQRCPKVRCHNLGHFLAVLGPKCRKFASEKLEKAVPLWLFPGSVRGFLEETPGKFRGKLLENFPESRNATNSRISGRHCRDLVCTSVPGCF